MTKYLVHCLALMMSVACAGGQAAPADSPPRPAAGEPLVAPGVPPGTNAPAVASPSATGRVSDDTRKLMPGDKLSFQILEDREPIKNLVVTDSSELDVPYVGRVAVAGKTCKQLGEELKALLEKDFYYRATVMIGLDQVSRALGRVYVWGQVRTQGAIEIPPAENFTVGKAILRAGGFGDFANKKKVKLVRNNPDGQKQSFELNMVSILEEGKTELDLTLQPDDFIIVPPRLVNW
jgi:polysaccharide export outer membrane protein